MVRHEGRSLRTTARRMPVARSAPPRPRRQRTRRSCTSARRGDVLMRPPWRSLSACRAIAGGGRAGGERLRPGWRPACGARPSATRPPSCLVRRGRLLGRTRTRLGSLGRPPRLDLLVAAAPRVVPGARRPRGVERDPHSEPIVIGFERARTARELQSGPRRSSPRPSWALVIHAWRVPGAAVVRRGRPLLAAPLREVSEITGDLDEMFAGQASDIAEAGASARPRARARCERSGGSSPPPPAGGGLMAAAEARTRRARGSSALVGACGARHPTVPRASASSGAVHHAELAP